MSTGLQLSHKNLFQEALQNGLQSYVNTASTRTATATAGTPAAGTFYSTITGRASIVDISADLRASFGIERIAVQSVVQLQTEFGPNGEPVFSALNDDRGMMRFIGNWQSGAGAAGAILVSAIGNSCEVTFYGTALNILTVQNGSAESLTVSVDGGTGTVLSFSSISTVIGTRNYAANQGVTLASALTLGVHTVKVTWATTANWNYSGFEVVNTASTTSLNINSGTAYIDGLKTTLSAAQTIGFAAAATGTRGGRMITYLTSAGAVTQAFQAVNAASAFLTAADHTNEEMVRTYSPREFGAGRSDDFSTLIGGFSSRAFTLDDGTTSLVGANVQYFAPVGIDGLTMATTSDFFTFTFVGTGLDLVLGNDSNSGGTSSVWTIAVDGTSQGTVTNAGAASAPKVFKVASGLPYGTHTAKVGMASLGASRLYLYSFKVYQPKKPSLPAGAVELADYNVMATYVANTSTTAGAIAGGVLRKNITRELIYSGPTSWNLSGPDASSDSGWSIYPTSSSASGNAIAYSFFGTGFDFRFTANTDRVATVNVTLNGVSLTTANFPTMTASVVGITGTFNPSTGVLSQVAGSFVYNAGLAVTGLPLGKYTIQFTSAGTGLITAQSIDIITPIHSAKSNLAGDLQNALPVGSCALSDNRQTSLIKTTDRPRKNYAYAQGLAVSPTTSSSAYVPVPDMSVTLNTSGGRVLIAYTMWSQQTSNTGGFQVYVDGAPVGTVKLQYSISPATVNLSDTFVLPLAAGIHKIDLYWSCPTTMTALAQSRTLMAAEI